MKANKAPYRRVFDKELAAMVGARFGGKEVAAYLRLTRYRDTAKPCVVWAAANQAAGDIGMTPRQWTESLHRIERRTFTAHNGKEYPALVQVERARSGRVATYYDNLYADMNGYPLKEPRAKKRPKTARAGTPVDVPKQDDSSGDSGTPVDVSWNACRRELERVQTFPKELKNIKDNGRTATLAPQAWRGGVASQPNQQSNQQPTLHVASSKPPLPARAATKEHVTYEEWLSIHEKFNQQQELTDEEKRAYSAGFHEYISIYRQGLVS